MTSDNIKHMLNASLISKNDKQFEKILQCLNKNERSLLKNGNSTDANESGNQLTDYFSINMKETKWSKGQRLLNAFLNSL